jgi:hypothetical protein
MVREMCTTCRTGRETELDEARCPPSMACPIDRGLIGGHHVMVSDRDSFAMHNRRYLAVAVPAESQITLGTSKAPSMEVRSYRDLNGLESVFFTPRARRVPLYGIIYECQ